MGFWAGITRDRTPEFWPDTWAAERGSACEWDWVRRRRGGRLISLWFMVWTPQAGSGLVGGVFVQLFHAFPQLGDHPRWTYSPLLCTCWRRRDWLQDWSARRQASARMCLVTLSLMTPFWTSPSVLCSAQMFPELRYRKLKAKKPQTSKQSCCMQPNYTSTQPEISRRHHSNQRKSKAFQVKHTRVITNKVNILIISSFSGFRKSTDRWIFTSAQGRIHCWSLLVILCYFALKSRVQAWKSLENGNKCKEKCSCFAINY